MQNGIRPRIFNYFLKFFGKKSKFWQQKLFFEKGHCARRIGKYWKNSLHALLLHCAIGEFDVKINLNVGQMIFLPNMKYWAEKDNYEILRRKLNFQCFAKSHTENFSDSLFHVPNILAHKNLLKKANPKTHWTPPSLLYKSKHPHC